jgi:hypothetical protein
MNTLRHAVDGMPSGLHHEGELPTGLPLSSRPVFGRRRWRGGRGVRFWWLPPVYPLCHCQALSGGGILPHFRRLCQAMAAPARLPAVKLGAHVTVQRQPPVFPPTKLAEVSPSVPFLTPPLQRPKEVLVGPSEARERGQGVRFWAQPTPRPL